MAHRGGAQIYPEHCFWTYDKQIANFEEYAPDVNLVLEADLQVLKYCDDLMVHHDDTLDRTTDGTGTAGGTTGVRSIGDLKSLTVDHYSQTNSLFTPTSKLKIPTAREFINIYGRQKQMNFDCKYTQSQLPLAQLIHAFRAEEYSLVYVTTAAARDFFLAEGIPVLTTGDATNYPATTPAALKAMGVNDVGFGYIAIGDTATWDIADDYRDAGINVWAGGSRRAEWKNYREHPTTHRGGYSDDPLWVTGKSPRFNNDQFAGRLHLPGHIPYTLEFPGNFIDLGGGIWGWSPNANQNGWCLWGWCSPHPKGGHGDWDILTGVQETKDPVYPFGIAMDIKRVVATSVNHWACVAFADDDMPVHDSRSAGSNTSGRHVLFFFVNHLGDAYIIEKVDAVDNVLASGNLGASGAGITHRYKYEYLSETNVRMTDMTTGLSLNAVLPEGLEGTGTNGYINVGTPSPGSGGQWAFSNVTLI